MICKGRLCKRRALSVRTPLEYWKRSRFIEEFQTDEIGLWKRSVSLYRRLSVTWREGFFTGISESHGKHAMEDSGNGASLSLSLSLQRLREGNLNGGQHT